MVYICIRVHSSWVGIYMYRNEKEVKNIVAAFQGMHMWPAKHSYAWLPKKCDYRTDGRTKWSLCAAMLRRRHNKICILTDPYFFNMRQLTLIFLFCPDNIAQPYNLAIFHNGRYGITYSIPGQLSACMLHSLSPNPHFSNAQWIMDITAFGPWVLVPFSPTNIDYLK